MSGNFATNNYGGSSRGSDTLLVYPVVCWPGTCPTSFDWFGAGDLITATECRISDRIGDAVASTNLPGTLWPGVPGRLPGG